MHTCAQCIHTYTHTMHTCIHVCNHTHTYIYRDTHTHTHAHTKRHRDAHTQKQTHFRPEHRGQAMTHKKTHSRGLRPLPPTPRKSCRRRVFGGAPRTVLKSAWGPVLDSESAVGDLPGPLKVLPRSLPVPPCHFEQHYHSFEHPP